MSLDKSWMQASKSTIEYFEGVECFLDYAYSHIQYEDMKILCPCIKCNNRYRRIRSKVHEHLLYRGIRQFEQPLYPNCEKYSNLSFVVKLMHIKCINGWSNKSFNMLLEFLKDAFPMYFKGCLCHLRLLQI
ncbi:hypothetical protein ACOSQ2_004456 [Xanthoceras sorbifolium]